MSRTIIAQAVEIPTPVGLVAVAITAAAVFGIVWMWRSTRPTPLTPGPATMELGDEPPAIVDLLTGGFDVDDDAVPATVIDLAHRGYYTIEKYGDRTVLRLREHVADQRQLTAYEQRVLQHIRRKAVDGVTPAEVLTLGEAGVSQRWFRAFAREVAAHGRELGLCRKRWGLRHLAIVWGLVVAAFAGPLVAGALAPRTDTPLGWGSVGNIASGVALVAAFGVAWLARNATMGTAQADTALGRDAATRWLGVREFFRTQGDFRAKEAASVAIWDDHLAYATAMGLARQVERELPFAAESDTRAWSQATGQWRKVRVSYWSPLPFWGHHPGRVLFSGLVQGAIVGILAYLAFQVASSDSSFVSESLTLDDDQLATVSLIATIATIALGALLLYCVAKVVIGAADLFRRRTIEGVVLRRRSYAEGLDKYAERFEQRFRLPFRISLGRSNPEYGGRRTQRNRFVAIDDGTRDRLRALQVDERTYAKFAQGATVSAKVSPLIGFVSDVTTIAPPPAEPSADRSPTHELITEAAKAAGGGLARGVERLSGTLGEAEAQQLRGQLAEADEQLDRLRADPALRNSPVAGFLDALGRLTADAPDPASDDPAPDPSPDRPSTSTDDR